jgi:protein involved in polysaccharide export with SLBB domain
MRCLLAILLVLLSVVVFAQPAERIIRPGDKLKMTCQEAPELNRTYAVSDDGFILVQFLGKVKVDGLSRAEAAKKISAQLLDFVIVRSATVAIDFEGSSPPVEPPIAPPAGASIKLLGEIGQPGEMPFAAGLRLSDAIRQAAPTESTDLTQVVIRRSGHSQTVDYSRNDPSTNLQNPVLMAGDEVVFSKKSSAVPPAKAGTVFVLGAVLRPGQVQISEGMGLRQAVQAVGGFAPNADRSRVRIERGSGPLVYNLSEDDSDAPLQDGDQIVVEAFNQPRYVEILGQIRSPGMIRYEDGMTLGQAILRSGGPSASAVIDRVELRRQGEAEEKITVNYSEIEKGYRGDLPLQPGDRIIIPGKRAQNGGLILGAAAGVLLFFLIGG